MSILDEAPSTLRSRYLLPSIRRERNPSRRRQSLWQRSTEAKSSSRSSAGLRPGHFAKWDKLPGRVAVHGLIFNKDNKILVLKRSETDLDEANCWDPPGGGLKIGENIENGFLRELSEETGIFAKNVVVLAAHEVDDGSLGLFAKAETEDEKVTLSEEHNDFKWISEEEFLTLKPASLHLRALQELFVITRRVIAYKDIPKI